jgi:CRP-like cAMP-binding protein
MYKAGDVLIRQGDKQDIVFVILRGVVQVSVVREEWGKDIVSVLKSVYDGAVFGETADQADGPDKDLA